MTSKKAPKSLIKTLKTIKDLSCTQKATLLPLLSNDVLHCLFECVHVTLRNKNISRRRKKILAKNLRKEQNLLRNLIKKKLSITKKRDLTHNLGGEAWDTILATSIPIINNK